MSSSSSAGRRDRVETVIARELASLAEANAGTLPRGYANRVTRTLKAEGVGIRRQDALRLIGEYAGYLQLPGTASQRVPERYAPAKSAAAEALKREAVFNVAALSRRKGISLTQAVRLRNWEHPGARVSVASVRRLIPNAFVKQGNRWQVTPYDRYARTTDALTTRGIVRVTVRDSRTASLIGRHAAAVRLYLEGKAGEEALRPFRGKRFRSGGHTYVLETDPATLERWGLGGEYDDLIIGSGQEIAA